MTTAVGRRSKRFGMRGLVQRVPPFWWVAIPLFAVYMVTPTPDRHIDPLTNAVTGWHLGTTGSPILLGYEAATAPDYYRNVGWFVMSPRGPVSQYPPGAALLSAPFYRLWGQDLAVVEVTGSNRPNVQPISLGIPPLAPAKLAASAATAVAMGLVAATVPFAGGSRLVGVATGYVGGLATSMWSVASSDLWQHGPAAMWIALGVYLTARSQLWWAGLSFGAAILTRPPLAVVVLIAGVVIAWHRSSPIPAFKLGAAAVAGLAVLLGYNRWLWGKWTVSGGYGSGFAESLVEGDFLAYLSNIGGAMVDPQRGLLMISPFLAVLIPGVREGWRDTPDWVRGAALGGLGYLLLVYKVNRFSGGEGFNGYRYPLEAMTAAAALLSVAYLRWVGERPVVMGVFWAGVAAALVIQVV